MLQRPTRRLPLNNLRHLLANSADLGSAGICRLLDLIRPALRKRNGEQSKQIIIRRLYRDIGFDEGLPFADQRAQLIGGEVETVEIGEAVLALDFVDAEFDFAEGVVFVFLEVGEGNFEYSSFERIVCVL